MKKLLFVVTAILSVKSTFAQNISLDDYNRAVGFMFQKMNDKTVFNLNVPPTWAVDSSAFLYITQTKDEKTFNKVDLATLQVQPLLDQQRLALLLSDSLKKPIQANALPLNNLKYRDRGHITFSTEGKQYQLDLNTYHLSLENKPTENEMESKSPDGKWIAFSKDYNLYLRSAESGVVKQLSSGGAKNYEYASWYGWGEIIEGENADRPPHFQVSWSPDSKWIQTYICDLRKGQKMYLLDWSVDTLYRPKLLSYYRGSPGDTDMVYMTPVVFNIEKGTERVLSEFRNVNQAMFEWSKDPGMIYCEHYVRGYQQVDLYLLDLNHQQSKLLFREKSNTNIDGYSSQLIDDLKKAIIFSEKDGWRQLYMLDTKTGNLDPLTKGAFYIHEISFVDKKSKTIYFLASGKEPGVNPYYQQLYKIGFDGKGLSLLTPEKANHVISMSPDGKYVVDNISAPDQPTQTVLRETGTGKIINELSRANIDALLEKKFSFTETFTAIARDGSTTIYGAMWKPSHFDASKKYPVIDQSYTGPHTNMFPRTFSSTLNRNNQALAELGFIVLCVDGMGTAGRSKAFHNVSYKNMGKNLTDHVLAIQQLAKKYSWIDADKVGIFGHSAGGYDAGHAVLEFPDFYKVAVASSADHDFRMEKDWWPEMYMGWPVDSTYQLASNITMAGNLKGKLLITHGGIDENVNPSATFKLAEALIKANKEFDMLILPSQRHGYSGIYNEYFTKKKWNYFVEHLLGQKPIWEFSFQ